MLVSLQNDDSLIIYLKGNQSNAYWGPEPVKAPKGLKLKEAHTFDFRQMCKINPMEER